MKKLSKDDPDYLFMGLFQNEPVTILMKNQVGDENGVYNMAIMGFLIDADSEWLYIGTEATVVREAVKRDDVLRVLFKGLSDDLEDSIPTPQGATH